MDYYDENAEQLYLQYRSMTFDEVHAEWMKYLPEQPGLALDIGAGSGRDAQALSERGWEVTAVEPSNRLRHLGESATAQHSVEWIADQLPELQKVRSLGLRFQLILVSAVWMHLPENVQERSFRILAELLGSGGVLTITYRQGPDSAGRHFYPIIREQLESWARNRALVPLQTNTTVDRLGRDDVKWETLCFRLADDGTGALPTLRHIIVNDHKATTYKLALLRCLTHIAEGTPGMVLSRTDEWVEIPLGLVAPYWIRIYQPLLLQHKLRQSPGYRGLRFAKEAFQSLANVSPNDLRVGQTIGCPELRKIMTLALRDASRTIADMPAHFITWANTNQQIFQAEIKSPRRHHIGRLDKESLTRFGHLRVPVTLWDCLGRYACWLEPAILHEWTQLMQLYNPSQDSGSLHQALAWREGKRDTGLIRTLVDRRLARNDKLNCVWSDRRLTRKNYEVDHCFPWSRWANNDLWNLLPTTTNANASKSEKLPAAHLLRSSRDRILNWWEDSFIGQPHEQQFFLEAQASLPLVGNSRNLEVLFRGLMQQRQRIKSNQQLVEWMGVRR